MRVGTKSILFGVHLWWWHPILLFIAWWKMYGFPYDPRLWVAFFLHDLGYWNKPNMDGVEGETHVEWGAKVMNRLFDKWTGEYEYTALSVDFSTMASYLRFKEEHNELKKQGYKQIKGNTPYPTFHEILYSRKKYDTKWLDFCLYHSRFYAKRDGVKPSKLCYADKLVICLEPTWWYLLRANLSGEVHEYLQKAQDRKEIVISSDHSIKGQIKWFKELKKFMYQYLENFKNGNEDTWTKPQN